MKPAITFLLLALMVVSVLSTKPIFFEVRVLRKNSTRPKVEGRIFRGTRASDGQFPFMIYAMMKVFQEYYSCSASLITPKRVLLAAHCISNVNLKPSDIILIGGRAQMYEYLMARMSMDYDSPIDEAKFGVQERRAKDFYIHPDYSELSMYYDVALVLLEKPFVLGKVQTIPLSMDKIKPLKNCTILGWGLTLSEFRNYDLNFLENRQVSTTGIGCRYRTLGPLICLIPDNSGICSGDSGSPLVCDGKVFGVASFYLSDSPDPNCVDSFESYYSEVYPTLSWIQSVSDSGNVLTVRLWNLIFFSVSGLWSSGKVSVF